MNQLQKKLNTGDKFEKSETEQASQALESADKEAEKEISAEADKTTEKATEPEEEKPAPKIDNHNKELIQQLQEKVTGLQSENKKLEIKE